MNLNELLEVAGIIPSVFLGLLGLRLSEVFKPDKLEQLNK